MIPTVENAALVALLRNGERRAESFPRLLEGPGGALAALEAERGVKAAQSRLFEDDRRSVEELIADATADIVRWERDGMQLLTVLDRDYPRNLRAVHDRPPLIFLGGRLEQRDTRSVAVIGSRAASSDGIAKARALASHLVGAGYAVVSGLATGIDTAAHTTALACGGRTLAVIGTGLARCYPAQNAGLQRRIATQCAVISRFWPDAAPQRRNFVMRNAVMSGLALATVIVEATHTSGARAQARLALAHGRPVFLLASLLAQPWAKELAARPGAHVVNSPEAVTAALERSVAPGAVVV